jgi:hypothetical protein
VFPLRSLRLKASDTVELRRWTEALQAGLRIARGGSHAAANATEGVRSNDAPLGVSTTYPARRPSRRPPLPHEELDDEPGTSVPLAASPGCPIVRLERDLRGAAAVVSLCRTSRVTVESGAIALMRVTIKVDSRR